MGVPSGEKRERSTEKKAGGIWDRHARHKQIATHLQRLIRWEPPQAPDPALRWSVVSSIRRRKADSLLTCYPSALSRDGKALLLPISEGPAWLAVGRRPDATAADLMAGKADFLGVVIRPDGELVTFQGNDPSEYVFMVDTAAAHDLTREWFTGSRWRDALLDPRLRPAVFDDLPDSLLPR